MLFISIRSASDSWDINTTPFHCILENLKYCSKNKTVLFSRKDKTALRKQNTITLRAFNTLYIVRKIRNFEKLSVW